MFAVTTRHTPPARGERIETCVARAVRTALHEGDGDVLAFLPGVPEIRRTATLLAGADLADVDVLQLHGRLRAAEQDLALTPGPRRRVVLSTAVAESSLTVPGVRAVVDAGLAPDTPDRSSTWAGRAGHRAGVGGHRGAARRACRAGGAGSGVPLLARGRAARPLSRAGDPHRRPHPARAGSGLLGNAGRRRAALVGPAAAGPLQAGQQVLRALGALDDGGVTDARAAAGRARAAPAAGPRAARRGGAGRCASGRRGGGADRRRHAGRGRGRGRRAAAAAVRNARGAGRWRVEVTRLRRLLPALRRHRHPRTWRGSRPGRRAGLSGAAGASPARRPRPQRAPRRVPDVRRHGRRAARRSPLAGQEWLAVAVADRTPAQHGRIGWPPPRIESWPSSPRSHCWSRRTRCAGSTATSSPGGCAGSGRSC